MAIRLNRIALAVAAMLVAGGCEHGNRGEAAMSRDSIPVGSELRPWRWQLDFYDFDGSRLSVYRDDRRIAQYRFDCNLEPPSAESGGEEGEGARIEVVYPQSHPAGLLVVICPVGAHSVQLELFDPLTDGQRALFHEVGSFYADWEMRGDRLWVRYDRPCTRPDDIPCEIGYETIERPWP